MTSGIYAIRNAVNGKLYVGQSVNIEKRLRAHRDRLRGGVWSGNIHLVAAWRKYGEDAFRFEILEACDPDQLDRREHWWIEATNCLVTGYNKRVWPTTNRGRPLSAEHRSRISRSLAGRQKSAEHASNAGKARRAKNTKTFTAAEKVRISEKVMAAKATHVFNGRRWSLRQIALAHGASPVTFWKWVRLRGMTIDQAVERAKTASALKGNP